MANTVSTISYANTFGQWMVATDALIAENNILAAGDYTKDAGTLYLSETTKNAIQANGSVVVQKQLLVQGVASSATIDNNLTVAGQIYFSNTTLGLTNSGQANINGLLIAQGPGIGLSVANNTYIGGNTTIRFNTITNTVQSNTSVNTGTASITGTTYTDKVQSNTSIITGTLQANSVVLTNAVQANSTILTNIIQANSSVNTSSISAADTTFTNKAQANTSVNTAIISVTGTTYTDILQANTSILTDTISANTSLTVPTITVGTQLNGNSASGFLNSLQIQGGGLSVNGNFVITGTTIYSANTFQLSTGVSSGITSYLQVARGSSGANAAIRWNEPLLYWETLDVTGNIYSRIITENYLANQTGSSANSAFLKANSAYASQNTTGTYANSAYAQANSASLYANGAFVQANAAYAQANSASLYANGAFVQANAAYTSQNTTGVYANSAFLRANSAYGSQNTTGVYANSAYAQANSASLYANGAFVQANSSYALANTFANTFVGTTGSVSQSSGVISFSGANGVTITATTANNLSISTPQDLRTTSSPSFTSASFTQPVIATTMSAGTSNTALATTAYVQNLANNSGTLTTNITGNAGTVTNGVYTNGSYANPTWITSLASSKITGLATSATTDTTNASNITSGTLGAARLPYSMDQAVASGSNVQHASLGIGTGASGIAGEIRATNNITAYYSDDRLKTRIGTIESALDKLCSLTGFYYEANETAQALGYKVKKEVGVSAQEVQKVLPEVVVPAPIDEQYLTVHYDRLLPLVIEAIKELKKEIDGLKGN